MKNEGNNYAFIDGQNLHLGTTKSKEKWKVDLYKFRFYLKRKYKVLKAFYFLGTLNENERELYTDIQDAGFILIFREHNSSMIGKKKGNVDVDLVFEVMRKLYKKEILGKVILVTGDGDYFRMVKFLIDENKFEKILFPNQKNSSSLYKKVGNQYFADLNDNSTRKKIKK